MRVLYDVDQAFLNKVQSLFEADPITGYKWFKEDENGDVDMSSIATDSSGKYVINYDKPIGRFANLDGAEQANAVALLETGKYAGVITDPNNNSLVRDRSSITWPEI